MRWMDVAWAELGEREVHGAASNPRILAYYKEAGHPDITRDEVPWCAAFMAYVLEDAGVDISPIPVSERLLARSYLKIGTPLPDGEFRAGAICVLARGSDPRFGHVGFITAWTDTHVELLGGNQDDSVSRAWFKRSSIVGVRWPQVVRPKDLKAQGSRIDESARKVRADSVKEAMLEVSKHMTDAIPQPGPAEFASAEQMAAAFGKYAASKWPWIALVLQAYILLRILYHSGLIRWFRAEDASTGKTTAAGG